ncbi:Exportin-2 [Aphelenchoides fujianensis]|nr:Exportin-2 [Aphelenchoides fujianensis]
MSEEYLTRILHQATYNAANIRQAEEELKNCARNSGYAGALLRILENESGDAGIRLAAAIQHKNFIRQNWNPESELAVANLEPNEREEVRTAVLTAMLRSVDPLRPQLCECVCLIGDRDFPLEWPQLIEILGQQLNADDLDRSFVSMACIEQLLSRYRRTTISNELILEIMHVIKSTGEPLTALFKRLVALVNDDASRARLSEANEERVFEVLLLATKSYLSLITQDFPAYFEDHMAEWMECFFLLLKIKADPHEHNSEPTHLDDIKRVECEIFAHFAQRFEEEFRPYMMRAIENVWQLLTDVDHRMRFDALVGVALGFLSAVSERAIYSDIFRAPGVLEAICQGVIIKNLTLRREDLEQLQDEPFDYLKRDVEGADLETRRRGATDFVRALTKHFEPEVFKLLSQSIGEYLAAYSANPAQEWLRKDVVYFLVSALASKEKTKRHGATSTSELIPITGYFNEHVRTDLFNVDFNSYPPILVADALNFVVLFRNQLEPQVLLEIFGGAEAPAVRILASDVNILHHYLGYAFDKLCSIQRQEIPLFNAQNIPVHDYIDAFCRALLREGANKSQYLLKGLLCSFSLIDPETARSSDDYVLFLVQMIDRAVQELQNQEFVDLVFECLGCLIKKTFPFIQSAIIQHVMPMVDGIVAGENTVDFVPYALHLVALLLHQAGGERKLGRTVVGAERYDRFFPLLLTGQFWGRQENGAGAGAILDAFIRTQPEQILTADNIPKILGLYQRLIEGRTFEEQGFQLAAALMPHYGLNELLTARNILLQMIQRLQSARTQRFVFRFGEFLVQFARQRGAAQLVAALDELQPGLYGMIAEKFLSPEQKAAIEQPAA